MVHYGKGSIFSEIFDFTLRGDKAVIKTYLEFCIDDKNQRPCNIRILNTIYYVRRRNFKNK